MNLKTIVKASIPVLIALVVWEFFGKKLMSMISGA